MFEDFNLIDPRDAMIQELQNKIENGMPLFSESDLKKEQNQEIIILMHEANSGNIDSMIALSENFRTGNMVDRDSEKSQMLFDYSLIYEEHIEVIELIDRLPENKSEIAYKLYNCYAYGTHSDIDKAIEYLLIAAHAGNRNAMGNLAYRYDKGSGIKKNPEEALNLHYQLVEFGDPWSILELGFFYLNTDSKYQDYKSAFDWFQRALNFAESLEQRHAHLESTCHLQISRLYQAGHGVNKDDDKAQFHSSMSEAKKLESEKLK